MRRGLVLALLGVGLLGCHHAPTEPYTRVVILNATAGALRVGNRNLNYWTSFSEYIVHGETLSLALSQSGTALGTLKVVSIVPADDPSDFDAGVTIREDSAGVLTAAEQSPYVDATVQR
jgi:hypothetical protein